MRAAVDLHRRVRSFLRHECTTDEQREFYAQLEVVRADPLGASEPNFDPSLSRYMLRSFRFGSNLAVFKFKWEAHGPRVRVVVCRKIRRSRK